MRAASLLSAIIPVTLAMSPESERYNADLPLVGTVDPLANEPISGSGATSGIAGPRVGRRVTWRTNIEETEEIIVPKTPFNQMYSRSGDLEAVEPLARLNEIEDILFTPELACEIYNDLQGYVADRKSELIVGLRRKVHEAGSSAAYYAIQKIFGYEITESDKSKLEDIFQNPAWISIAISHLHSACTATTSTTTTMM